MGGPWTDVDAKEGEYSQPAKFKCDLKLNIQYHLSLPEKGPKELYYFSTGGKQHNTEVLKRNLKSIILLDLN